MLLAVRYGFIAVFSFIGGAFQRPANFTETKNNGWPDVFKGHFPAHKCTKKTGLKKPAFATREKALKRAVINKKKFYQQIHLLTFVFLKNDTFVGEIKRDL